MGFFAAVQPAPVPPSQHRLAQALPTRCVFGTSSWSFPGWDGLVYQRDYAEKALAQHGLEAYAQHPLLGAVGVDRTFYSAVPTTVFDHYGRQAPAPFRFLVKCPQSVTRRRIFTGPVGGGSHPAPPNPLFLDVDDARASFFEPLQDSTIASRSVALMQFTHEPDAALPAAALAKRLDAFFSALAPTVRVALEVRTPAYLDRSVRDVLKSHGVLYAVSSMRGMPPIQEQATKMAVLDDDQLVARWLLRRDLTYQDAKKRFFPFGELGAPDVPAREAIAALVLRFSALDKATLVIVNNKAEGSAPRSIWGLSQHITRTA